MKNRIKELRLKHNLTLKELGQKVGMADSAICRYETGKRQPNIEKCQKIADYFDVSVPYLQGFININIPNNFKFDSKKDAVDCIKKIMKALDISKEDLEKNIDDEGGKDAKR
ncbi:helix-turn-helix domain-containing protein [Lactobacillus crispatus]|jgi:transcriptional regulator with XRE-family HTH domain|nr:helix-turn-helix domain-containing protein [Lactobacillus crispatus]